MRSVVEINDAQDLLRTYCDPTEPFGWPLYDIDPAPDVLSGADLTAPALLSYPVRGKYLNAMGQSGTPYATLVDAMADVLRAPPQRFVDVPAARVAELSSRIQGQAQTDDAFGRLIRCLDLVQDCLTSVFVTKVLHRKRPHLVPINDSLVRRFYGLADAGYSKLFVAIHSDLSRHDDFLSDLTSAMPTEIRDQLGPVRALDITIWLHETLARSRQAPVT